MHAAQSRYATEPGEALPKIGSDDLSFRQFKRPANATHRDGLKLGIEVEARPDICQWMKLCEMDA